MGATGDEDSARLTVQLRSEEGIVLGTPLDIPVSTSQAQLTSLANQLLGNQDDPVPCSFYLEQDLKIAASASSAGSSGIAEVTHTLGSAVESLKKASPSNFSQESMLYIVYQPLALFRVRPVTRCTSSLPGHGEAIISAAFSPDGTRLASGSGDTTVRFWDVHTETPEFTAKGHGHWILALAWSPDGKRVASGDKKGDIFVWDPDTGKKIGTSPLKGHRGWIGSLAFEPLHLNPACRQLCSASKDGDVRIWDVQLGNCVRVLAGHKSTVTCVKWGGTGLIYSASQDRTIKVWRASDGVLCRTLQGHGHWVNTMALHTDYVLRTGAYDPSLSDSQPIPSDASEPELKQAALERYKSVAKDGPERLMSGSDDFTMYLWHPETDTKPVARLTGHQQLINQVLFSPDARLVASASFDKSIKLWNGRDGKFLATLRGHVQAVYQIAFSADSRLLVSGSADSTVKLWDLQTKQLAVDLPGHADEVYAVDWAPDGQRVVSGGKDRVLKIWRK